MENEQYHERLRKLMDSYVHLIYKLTKSFPKEELYGVISQIRRAALSVILNYIEGFARGKGKSFKNFLDISYGSLKESQYLLMFSFEEHYVVAENYRKALELGEEIGAMLWGTLKGLKEDLD